MRVIIDQEEILTAIEDYILDAVKVPDDMRIDINLKATRGDVGYTAEIDIVSENAPTDGSDRSVDPRVEPTPEAREEGLGIVAKIDEARQQVGQPRRRGRPPGSKNKPKDTEAAPQTTTAPVTSTEPSEETPDNKEAEQVAEVQAETKDTPEVQSETQPTPEQEQLLTASNEEHIEQAKPLDLPAEGTGTSPTPDTPVESAPAADVPAGNMSSQTSGRALFGNLSDAGDPAPASAETQTTEPAQPEEPAPAAEAPKTRSLFADLTKPTN